MERAYAWTHKSVSDFLTWDPPVQVKPVEHNGVFYGSLAQFVSILGASLTFPFLQSQRDLLKCDALCYGSMQSVRSALSLLGTVVAGRLSDKLGRIPVLWIGVIASLISLGINYTSPTIAAMWISMIPSALNQNWSVLKALFADYSNDVGGDEKKRAVAVGRLGMAVGISFMVGPILGATILSSYQQAIASAFCLTFLSGLLILKLPTPKGIEKKEQQPQPQGGGNPILAFLHLPAARLPGSRLLFFMRAFMSLAFHVFMTVWTVSLKERFNFSSRDHANFMGWVGLWYALSQGYLAKWFITDNPTNALLWCVVGLGGGRLLAILTTSLPLVYAIMAAVIVALGVMNTAMASACARLADQDQVGGLIGVTEAVESAAGLVGPAFGGLLHHIDPRLPVVSVVGIYALVFVAVFWYYKATIVDFRSSVKVGDRVKCMYGGMGCISQVRKDGSYVVLLDCWKLAQGQSPTLYLSRDAFSLCPPLPVDTAAVMAVPAPSSASDSNTDSPMSPPPSMDSPTVSTRKKNQ